MSRPVSAGTAGYRDLANLVALVDRHRDHVLALRDVSSAHDEPGADAIASWLYRTWYSAPPEAVLFDPLTAWHPDLAAAYRGALSASRRWTEGWVVLHVGPGGTCVAGRRGATREVGPGAYVSLSRPGVPVAPGDAVAVSDCVSWVDWSSGFWTTCSTPAPNAPLVRMYWSVGAAAVTDVLVALTDALEAQTLRYSLKCPVWPSAFARVDTLVLYLERLEWDAARDPLTAVARAVEGRLRPWWPPLTSRLAPGVSWADDPGTGETFGQSRCRLLAAAVCALAEHPRQPGEERIAVLSRMLAAAGLDPERPWLNGKG